MVGVFALLDAFVLIIPIEAFLIPSVVLHPKRWISSAIWVASGSAVGALLLGAVASHSGLGFLSRWMPEILLSPGWIQAQHLFESHGPWTLGLIAWSPIPQQPAIAFAGLSQMSLWVIFSSVFTGRILKYGMVTWLASQAPDWWQKLKK